MAFPDVSVVDNFNSGATQNLTARTGWSSSVVSAGDTAWQTDATPTLASDLDSGASSALWGTPFEDACMFYTWKTGANGGAGGNLWARLQTTSAPPTGISLFINAANWQLAQIYKNVALSSGPAISISYAIGDSVALRVQGDIAQAWQKVGAGAWTLMTQLTCTRIAGAGLWGFDQQNISGSAVTIDDFGIGSLGGYSDGFSGLRKGDRGR